jgi:hypothetical protein
MKKYNLILNPSLKKNWIHFNIEIFEEGKDGATAHHYSTSYGGNPDYPAFRPDVERDIEERINEYEINMEYLRGRCYPIDDKFWGNINSVKIKNPVYYCLKSKVVWQNDDDEENPTYSDKLLQVKTYEKYEQKGNNIVVTECQRDRMEDYIEGGEFVEIKREHIKEYEELTDKMVEGQMRYREYDKERFSLFLRMMEHCIKKRY